MAQATGSLTQFAYFKETTPGTVPAGASTGMKALYGVQQESLAMTKGNISDNAIRPTGMKKFLRHGNRSVGGSVTFSYAAGTQDDLLEAALWGTWATNVLKLASVENSYVVEVGHTALPMYSVYKGVHVAEYTLNVPSGNQLVTAEYGLLGMDGVLPSATPTDSTLTAPTLEGTPFVHLSGTFNMNGSPIAYFTGLQVKVSHNLSQNYALGSAIPRSITKGMSTVTGQVTAYFESAALATPFFNESSSQTISFVLTDGTNSHTYLLPNVKWNSHSAPVNGDGPVIVTATFEALEDATEGTAIKITRA